MAIRHRLGRRAVSFEHAYKALEDALTGVLRDVLLSGLDKGGSGPKPAACHTCEGFIFIAQDAEPFAYPAPAPGFCGRSPGDMPFVEYPGAVSPSAELESNWNCRIYTASESCHVRAAKKLMIGTMLASRDNPGGEARRARSA